MEPNVLERILDGREEPTNLPFELLKNITLHFSNERIIGEGGCAAVYKGILPNGNVAVKRIINYQTVNEKLFYRELDCLLETNHPNIVRLLGFCANTEHAAIKIEGSRERIYAEIRERLLCFEYISNGDLAHHITDELRGLEWSTRYKIIKGICDGLHYLHMEKHIYHLGLKPADILLDSDMVPKIAGFGPSRLDGNSQTMSSDRFRSIGYWAPEYADEGKMSFKSDIYSLGIIITELVTGQRFMKDNINKNNILRRWRHRWRKTGKGSPLSYQQVAKCIDIGLLCKEMDPSKRPSIMEIVCGINEMESIYSETNNDKESAGCPISPYSDDQMLWVEPLELHFSFELNKHISSSLELTNEMGAYIAFKIQNTSPLNFCIEPTKGIMPPQSKCIVKITLRAHEEAPQYMQQAYAFILRSTKVKDGLEAEDITVAMFDEELDDIVDEVNLDVVLDTLQSELLDVHKLELPFPLEPNNLAPVVFKLELLKAITGDFSTTSELGRGAYGVVYKGVYPSGEIIAVKKLKSHLVEDETFQNEVSYLMRIKHRHVVQFVGYCAESSWELMPQPVGRPLWFEVPKRLICLEYVCNKSLDNYISDQSTGLDWNMRYEIIKGICNGLHFLHEECRIVHLDLKPENIMMDAAFIPKITDFGLARIFGNKETRIVTDKHLGTRGYMAPEYTIQGLITTKADIFSLGVIIIQIVTGHKEYPLSSSYFQLFSTNDCPVSIDISLEDFMKNVVGSWRKEFKFMLNYKSTEKYTQQVKRCMEIALKCVDPDMKKRHTAKDILQLLTAVDKEGLSAPLQSESHEGRPAESS